MKSARNSKYVCKYKRLYIFSHFFLLTLLTDKLYKAKVITLYFEYIVYVEIDIIIMEQRREKEKKIHWNQISTF